jgi:putative radical SAM enzyme (TIGR03279 family)
MRPYYTKKNPVICHIEPNSPAEEAGMMPHDQIISINGQSVNDLIDLQFFGSDPDLSITVNRGGRLRHFDIHNPEYKSLGIDPDPMETRYCGNHCLFCFIDQNPKGLRDTLYVKDEDYRLSFLLGNYVTLTHVSLKDLNRIAEQKLSPLYVSVHAADPGVRKTLLGLKKDDRLMDKIRFLAEQGIEIHAQIVLCPGLNDGDILEETIATLSSFFPQVGSVAVVPVGLTRHRRDLPVLTPVSRKIAGNVIGQIQSLQDAFMKKWNHPFVFLADEFYLSAGNALPEAGHYGEYWQIENGVGMTRAFLDSFNLYASMFPKILKRSEKIAVITGTLAAPVLEKLILPEMKKIKGLDINLVPVENRFYGESVTVSGLLTGQDIQRSLQPVKGCDRILIPMNSINHDGLFLDGMRPEDLTQELGQPVVVMEDFEALWL